MLNVSVQGADLVIRQLSTIKSPTVRRRIFMQAARQLIKSSKARVSSQTDLDGQAFAPHAKGRKRKMLARLIRRLAYTMTDAGAEVGWKNSFEGGIAYKQQFGFTQTVTKESLKNNDKSSSKKGPVSKKQANALRELGPVLGVRYASRQQAKALINAGYKVPRAGRKNKLTSEVVTKSNMAGKTPTLKWITQNLTMGQAGLILAILRVANSEWKTTLPPRSFMGVTAEDLKTLSALINTELQNAFNGVVAA